jgi:hypothetical protein
MLKCCFAFSLSIAFLAEQDSKEDGRIHEIPEDEIFSELSLKQHLIQNQTSTGDLKDIDAVKPMGTHILNKDHKDINLED